MLLLGYMLDINNQVDLTGRLDKLIKGREK